MSTIDYRITRLDKEAARKLVKAILAADGPIIFTGYFLRRAKERKFSTEDAMNVLKQGTIYDQPELERGSWRYRIETNKMVVVISFSEDGEGMISVTGWWKEEGRKL